MPKRGEFLYEGKAKKIYATDDPGVLWMYYKDDATAFDGAKKGVIPHKGIMNNRVTNLLFRLLEKNGIETHLLEEIDERNVLVKKLDMIPVEIVVRNRVAGSLAKRLGLEEGTELKGTILEFYYKNDELGDPMINEYHAEVMGWATREELKAMQEKALEINEVLLPFFDSIGIILVDYKLEFGRLDGRIVLGDEISPDTCRLWDKVSLEKLDKDRFRRDLGKEEEAYMEVVRRIEGKLAGLR
ncbi:phosphoribosylaminoimidazole-succinocarboxamide synthase [Thermosyntropha lipolytica DSM 11003]|uniref:Phosphoribosylaminoimidazole-succinocarboxamide synthase n=1 Tax=Thermosyntropha lipolytica DSM 11003 TaxID=1123382 RepID=A0A1M5JBV6_9FIRM|nr:phosphoribosylaminoimidazolesuccinocarboxamide synthase [Thermosyntropha lipolytica]SHG37483.1 phosphoribosylaminoimidazole-succinocarboxamide synthase [Thermosyntropha lipolytica DSM 11003]